MLTQKILLVITLGSFFIVKIVQDVKVPCKHVRVIKLKYLLSGGQGHSLSRRIKQLAES